MMDYKLIAALSAVIDSGGFEKAAKLLHLSQSAVSQRIKLLESQMGRQLLVRTSPPTATSMGIKLDMHWKRIQILEQELGLITQNDKIMPAKIAVNADSLATWFADALAPVSSYLSFELEVEDQDVGLIRMKQGDVLACLCSSDQSVNGADVDYVGHMDYYACASPDFINRFDLDTSLSQLTEAPCLVYNHDDQLQFRFLHQIGLPRPEHIHYCPSSEGFVRMALSGCGYGLIPELQVREHLASGTLIRLQHTECVRIPLYWHSWRSGGDLMKQLKIAVLKAGKHNLTGFSQQNAG